MQVSIILPTRNEVKHISRTIDSILANNKIDEKCEILIVDGNSNDGSLEILENYIQQYPFIKLINNPQSIVSSGFNLALNRSVGEIIVRIDGHCQIPSNYLTRCKELLGKTDSDIVGGTIETIPIGKIGSAISIAQSTWFGVGSVEKPFYRDDIREESFSKEQSGIASQIKLIFPVHLSMLLRSFFLVLISQFCWYKGSWFNYLQIGQYLSVSETPNNYGIDKVLGVLPFPLKITSEKISKISIITYRYDSWIIKS